MHKHAPLVSLAILENFEFHIGSPRCETVRLTWMNSKCFFFFYLTVNYQSFVFRAGIIIAF